MDTSVESVCNLLARSRLLAAEEVKQLYPRWVRDAGAKAKDTGEFGQWLVAKQYVTQYQAEALLRGHADHFFFNEYKLLDRIGKGKMAGVYKAAHRLGQVVAIKVLPPSKVKDPEAFGRFQREARLARRLKHPNVVRTFQVGHVGNLHYLVMEYLEGETLAEVLQRRGKLPPPEAAQFIYQALLGLQHIHEQSMVHRDLNPGNLMILPSPAPGEPGVVKILDIGLGRADFDEKSPGNEENLTREDSVLGSPDYLAPEQAKSAHTSDIRADIYSLGCVLYHMIAGQPPFEDKNAVRKMIRHASEKPLPLATHNPSVPEALQKVVDNMLAKDPAQRYATPGLAAKALRAYLQNQTMKIDAATGDNLVPAYLSWLESEAPEAIPVPGGGPAPMAIAVNPANIDVELVPVGPPPGGSRRGLVLVLIGALLALIFLLGLGAVIFWLTR